jgi:hypothetical protein
VLGTLVGTLRFPTPLSHGADMYLHSLVEITHLTVEVMYLTVEIEYGAVEYVLLYDHIYLYMDMYDLCGVGHFHNRSCV